MVFKIDSLIQQTKAELIKGQTGIGKQTSPSNLAATSTSEEQIKGISQKSSTVESPFKEEFGLLNNLFQDQATNYSQYQKCNFDNKQLINEWRNYIKIKSSDKVKIKDGLKALPESAYKDSYIKPALINSKDYTAIQKKRKDLITALSKSNINLDSKIHYLWAIIKGDNLSAVISCMKSNVVKHFNKTQPEIDHYNNGHLLPIIKILENTNGLKNEELNIIKDIKNEYIAQEILDFNNHALTEYKERFKDNSNQGYVDPVDLEHYASSEDANKASLPLLMKLDPSIFKLLDDYKSSDKEQLISSLLESKKFNSPEKAKIINTIITGGSLCLYPNNIFREAAEAPDSDRRYLILLAKDIPITEDQNSFGGSKADGILISPKMKLNKDAVQQIMYDTPRFVTLLNGVISDYNKYKDTNPLTYSIENYNAVPDFLQNLTATANSVMDDIVFDIFSRQTRGAASQDIGLNAVKILRRLWEISSMDYELHKMAWESGINEE